MLGSLGVLTTVARYQPPNLIIIVFDNGVYLTTGSGRAVAASATGTDIEGIGRAAGLTHTCTVGDMSAARPALDRAFNEPGSSLSSRTRLKTLAKSTIDDNARFFDRREDVPIYAITMGVGTILEARKLILLANGKKKADAIAAAVEGPVTSMITASALQLHPDAVVFVDDEAAGKLKMREYFEWVRDKKPHAPRL